MLDLNKKTFRRLGVGVHDIVITGWEILQTSGENKEDYIHIEFAPVNEPENVHATGVFENNLNTLVQNLQAVINKPGISIKELLDESVGKTFTSTHETVTKEGRTYYNWYLGWVRPVTEPEPQPETESAPKRKRRA